MTNRIKLLIDAIENERLLSYARKLRFKRSR